VLVIAKSVGDAFNYSVFDHQLMLKGLPFVGYQAETVVRRAHLDANIIMSKPDEEHPSLNLVESGDRIMEVLDRDKTVNAFPVMGAPSAPGARPNFMGIISRGSLWDLIREHGETCDKIDITTRVEVRSLSRPAGMHAE
jgi:chloride channel 7